MDVINGEQYRLEYGYTAVKCRSQHDIECNKPIEEALEEEAEFFRRHSKYSSIANKSGIRALA